MEMEYTTTETLPGRSIDDVLGVALGRMLNDAESMCADVHQTVVC